MRVFSTASAAATVVLSTTVLLPLGHAVPFFTSSDNPNTARRVLSDGSSFHAAGYQSSSDNGPSYAATVIANPADDGSILITGSTYGTNVFRIDANDGVHLDQSKTMDETGCFLMSAKLLPGSSSSGSKKNAPSFSVQVQQLLQTNPAVSHACQNLVLHNNNKQLLVAGNSLENGVLHALYQPGTLEETTQYGMLLQFDFPQNEATSGSTKPFDLVGGRLLQDAASVYPLQVLSVPGDEWIYVASMVSSSGAMVTNNNDALEHINPPPDANLLYRYGSQYGMSISKYHIDTAIPYKPGQVQETIYQGNGFEEFFAPRGGESVFVEGLIKVSEETLVVVGSTRGQGPAFGAGEGATVIAPNSMDGFVTQLKASSGELLHQDDNAFESDLENDGASGHGQAASLRIESVDGKEDYVLGACHDAKDFQHIYVVGATQGQISSASGASATIENGYQAFLIKIKLDTMTEVWSLQLGADHSASTGAEGVDYNVRALACDVTRDGQDVWIAGTVGANAVIEDAQVDQSAGGTDIFAAKINAQDGQIKFVRQAGSQEDDALAYRGGITTDLHGNAILVGNTHGEFYRPRSSFEKSKKLSDIFITTVERETGAMAFTADHPDFVAPTPQNHAQNPASPGSNDDGSQSSFGSFLIPFLFLSVILGAGYVHYKQTRGREVITDRSKVLGYLSDFDVEDVDLKHSATGGWHCSYANGLAQGRNAKASMTAPTSSSLSSASSPRLGNATQDPLTAPLTSSSGRGDRTSKVLEGSLFMDDDGETGSVYSSGSAGEEVGGEARGGGSGSGYDGLVDAYNQTWDDRSNERRSRSSNNNNESSSSVNEHRSTNEWGRDII